MVKKARKSYENFINYFRTSIKDYNPRSAFEFLLALISSQVDADCCLLIDKYEQILFKSPTLQETSFSQAILKRALLQKSSILIKNAAQENSYQNDHSIAGNIFLSVICIVLKDEKENILGALYLDRHHPEKAPFTVMEMELTEDFISNFTPILITEGKEKMELHDLRQSSGFAGLIGRSKTMKKIYEQIEKVSKSDSNVLLQGKTGTGKELVARAIHRRSRRSQNPFIALNCSAIPRDLLESELFGHEEGSFTGAIEKRKGKFLLADKGTLFLDEIGDLDLNLQTKLLRVLQEGEIQPIGSENILKVDIRLITASSKDLVNEIRGQNFRKELFYRINSYPIFLPPLKDRGNDIILLAEFFLQEYCSKNYKFIPVPYFSPKAKQKLLSYSWEGNVRELQNTMENLSINCADGKIITAEQIKFYPISLPSETELAGSSLKDIAEKAEVEVVRKALKKHKWNRAKVIEELKTTYPTLSKIIKKYNLEDKD